MTAYHFTHFLCMTRKFWINGCEQTRVKTSFRWNIQGCIHCISNPMISFNIQRTRTLPDDEISALENLAIVDCWRLMYAVPFSSRMLPNICQWRDPLHDRLSMPRRPVDSNKTPNDMTWNSHFMPVTIFHLLLWPNFTDISFSAPNFSHNLTNLETTIDIVSTWMSANLLSLNQSKTEFLRIGLPKQLSKISDPALLMPSNVTIISTDAARNLGVILDSSLTMSDHISSFTVTELHRQLFLCS